LSIVLIVFFFNKSRRTTKKLAQTLANLNDTQEQLIQSEKFASLGRLVKGVAHEINTPLSIAITANSLIFEDSACLKKKIENNALSKASLIKHITTSEESSVMVDNALERVKNLVDDFKLVSADQVIGAKREVNLFDYIREVASTLSRELEESHISYQCSGDDQICITTIPAVLYQVITNLITNSIIHAFKLGCTGEISIRVSYQEQGLVEIDYRDNGKGMDEETLKNIFEPFFTTNRAEGNTGLGMNIVFNLVTLQLQGDISVESEENVGTFIKLVLPTSI
jgi:signal transduction histidine kinase